MTSFTLTQGSQVPVGQQSSSLWYPWKITNFPGTGLCRAMIFANLIQAQYRLAITLLSETGYPRISARFLFERQGSTVESPALFQWRL
jgi:hypothetical protein